MSFSRASNVTKLAIPKPSMRSSSPEVESFLRRRGGLGREEAGFLVLPSRSDPDEDRVLELPPPPPPLPPFAFRSRFLCVLDRLLRRSPLQRGPSICTATNLAPLAHSSSSSSSAKRLTATKYILTSFPPSSACVKNRRNINNGNSTKPLHGEAMTVNARRPCINKSLGDTHTQTKKSAKR